MEKICYMDNAYKQALLSLEHQDVPVGAVIVKDGSIIAEGRNKRILENNALLHAEVDAIQNACKVLNNWRLDGCTLYVTLEPCIMCVGAIIQSRISNVVFGALDPKAGCVVSKYRIFDENRLIHKVNYEYNEDDRCSVVLSNFFENKRIKIN
jgi:tRNA(adenine34) deaminase